MVLEERAALLLKRGLNKAAEHAKHAGKKDSKVNLGVHDVDGRIHRLSHRCDVEIELVAGPARLDRRAARDVLLELVKIVGDAAPGFILTEIVRQVDVDGLTHIYDIGRRSALFKQSCRSMIWLMKPILAPLMMMIASSAVAQTPLAQAPATQPPAGTATWEPAAPYISAGQDEPGYRSWYLAGPWRGAQVKAFNDYLVANQVGGVLPTWQLLRTATSWKACGQQPFEVPPAEEWPHMVQTLRYIRDYVVPAVGPVEPVSVYRNPVLNVCAGGAPESAHKLDSAVDLVPLRPTDRVTLMRTLCGVHSEHGAAYNAGLGFYAYLRFHVDSTKYRRWNMDPAVAAECPPIIHPEDVASIGQPIAPPTPVQVPAAPPVQQIQMPTAPVAAAPGTAVTSSPQRSQPHSSKP